MDYGVVSGSPLTYTSQSRLKKISEIDASFSLEFSYESKSLQEYDLHSPVKEASLNEYSFPVTITEGKYLSAIIVQTALYDQTFKFSYDLDSNSNVRRLVGFEQLTLDGTYDRLISFDYTATNNTAKKNTLMKSIKLRTGAVYNIEHGDLVSIRSTTGGMPDLPESSSPVLLPLYEHEQGTLTNENGYGIYSSLAEGFPRCSANLKIYNSDYTRVKQELRVLSTNAEIGCSNRSTTHQVLIRDQSLFVILESKDVKEVFRFHQVNGTTWMLQEKDGIKLQGKSTTILYNPEVIFGLELNQNQVICLETEPTTMKGIIKKTIVPIPSSTSISSVQVTPSFLIGKKVCG